jgi:hypothetical protein
MVNLEQSELGEYVVVKVLFFDTSVLIKKFVDEDGHQNVKWLTSSDTKVSNSLHFCVNEQVCIEFERKIKNFGLKGKLSAHRTEWICYSFAKHYKNKDFRVIGQNIISNTKHETSFDTISKDLNLKAGKNDWDGLIYQSIINALASFGYESHPILVTCDVKFGRKVKSKGYRVINPEKQTLDEIRATFAYPSITSKRRAD